VKRRSAVTVSAPGTCQLKPAAKNYGPGTTPKETIHGLTHCGAPSPGELFIAIGLVEDIGEINHVSEENGSPDSPGVSSRPEYDAGSLTFS
jgi:hypothetical protein